LGFYGKIKSCDKKGFSLSPDIFSQFPTMRMLEIELQTWCLNFRSNSERVQDHHFSEIGLVVCRKKRGFWEGKRENELDGKMRHRN